MDGFTGFKPPPRLRFRPPSPGGTLQCRGPGHADQIGVVLVGAGGRAGEVGTIGSL